MFKLSIFCDTLYRDEGAKRREKREKKWADEIVFISLVHKFLAPLLHTVNPTKGDTSPKCYSIKRKAQAKDTREINMSYMYLMDKDCLRNWNQRSDFEIHLLLCNYIIQNNNIFKRYHSLFHYVHGEN